MALAVESPEPRSPVEPRLPPRLLRSRTRRAAWPQKLRDRHSGRGAGEDRALRRRYHQRDAREYRCSSLAAARLWPRSGRSEDAPAGCVALPAPRPQFVPPLSVAIARAAELGWPALRPA